MPNAVGKTPVTVDIAEVEFSARCQDPVSFVKYTLLVRAEVDHTVADDEVHGLVEYSGSVQVLNLAFHKFEVGLPIS